MTQRVGYGKLFEVSWKPTRVMVMRVMRTLASGWVKRKKSMTSKVQPPMLLLRQWLLYPTTIPRLRNLQSKHDTGQFYCGMLTREALNNLCHRWHTTTRFTKDSQKHVEAWHTRPRSSKILQVQICLRLVGRPGAPCAACHELSCEHETWTECWLLGSSNAFIPSVSIKLIAADSYQLRHA